MQKILIIRSAGFQQLDKNMPEIVRHFPDSRISLLTHEHGVQPAQKYRELNRIHVYPYAASFHPRRRVPELAGKSFDAVVVLVANLSGSGFLNVLRFALTIRAKRYYICNLVSEIREVRPADIRLRHTLNLGYIALAGCMTAIAAPFAAAYLLLQWKRMTGRKS